MEFGFLRQRLRPLYSETGRPSVDPEVLLRMLLIGYLYGITSERRLGEDVGMRPTLPPTSAAAMPRTRRP